MRSKREQRHCSVIYKNGTPIGFGFNDESRHAEENAYEEAMCDIPLFLRKPSDTKGLTMVNIRLTRAGRIALSKPCPACLELLKEKKFRKVVFSTNEGTFEEIYL